LILRCTENYIFLLLIHIFIGVIIYEFPFLSKIYAYLILVVGFFIIVKNKNKNNEVFFVSAYLVGSEVLLRMSYGSPIYEFGKYGIILFALLGMYFSSFNKKSRLYLIFILLLIPSVILSFFVLKTSFRQRIIFDILGPLSLAIFSIYTFKRPINIEQLNNILFVIGLPILSTCMFLFMFSFNINEIYFITQSSAIFSGNYGPNQVATILGLGLFIFFTRLIFKSQPPLYLFINLFITLYFGYRGLLTFSRGGILTALVIILFFILLLVLDFKSYKKFHLKSKLIFCTLAFFSILSLTAFESKGILIKRYANEDIRGIAQDEPKYIRKKLIIREFQKFIENPIFGIGVGKGKQDSLKELGKDVSTHCEITRMLSEHGIFGSIALFILIITPLLLYYENPKNIYFFSFYLFWLLTISHSGMRLAAPSFLYALSLLNINDEK
jgi:hypothetical protein